MRRRSRSLVQLGSSRGRRNRTPARGTRPPEGAQDQPQGTDRRRLKLTVVGDGTVGKTCLLHAFVNGTCPDEAEYIPTVFDNSSLDWSVGETPVQLSLWDTAGQEEYGRLRRLIYPATDIFVLCYAVDNVNSFKNISSLWWPELRHDCPNTPIVLVGEYRLGAAGFLECSARACQGVREVFDVAARGAGRAGAAGQRGIPVSDAADGGERRVQLGPAAAECAGRETASPLQPDHQ
ncbi:rho-related GTP-binding protein RhoA-A-like [Pollicipes pollicipes]|uniref:rho-related GTP-binding protein RhoA-A-like n=1 Tax=Pollicipes pollicipes TaxID=41117 RepID=UPI0018853C73|nr:rho-related GTP-binding protein RhoA-A-like [Pollicipes pollicipes]